MRRLTNDEEIMIIKSLDMDNMIDNGASRMVFECSPEAAELLGVNSDNYIIKLAMGLGGLTQSANEINAFLEHPNAPLAKIIATGKYTEVMEYVECDEDFRDLAGNYADVDSYIEDNDLDNKDGEYDYLYDVMKVIGALEDIFGSTSDNGQIGKNINGDWVAYDYGFDTETDFGSQVSDISDSLNRSIRKEYIAGLINLLQNEKETLEEFEEKFLRKINNPGEDYVLDAVFEGKRWGVDGEEIKKWSVRDSTFSQIQTVENFCSNWSSATMLARRITHRIYDDNGYIIREEMIENTFTPEIQEFFDKDGK